jgi:hypothetical protein
MLWSEKIHFVSETIEKQYFPETKMYGWCDIGYFRNDKTCISREQIKKWPNKEKIEGLDTSKIYYALVNQNQQFLNHLIHIINNKNSNGVPSIPVPPNQVSISGGFFMLHKSKAEWWKTT